MNQYAVNGGVLVQLVNQRFQCRLGGIFRQIIGQRQDACLLAGLAFVANVYLGCRIVTDQYHGQPGRSQALLFSGFDTGGHLLPDLCSNFFSVNQFGAHVSVLSVWA